LDLQAFIKTKEFKILIKIIIINFITYLFNNYFLLISINENLNIILVSLLISYLLYCLMFYIGAKRLKQSFHEYCLEKNKFYIASDDAGAKNSQPSLLHVIIFIFIIIYIINETLFK
jgi:hypothetical protein